MKTEGLILTQKQFDQAKTDGKQIINYTGYSVIMSPPAKTPETKPKSS